ncbi:MAG: 4Fe-4S binding protein [Armatimonadetes bacterium]|nr:4Fe-4S binding protein [Armatimonadota bacterium]
MIDLTDRLIQTPTLLKAPNGNARWHPGRRALQVLCGVLLVVLPLTNGLRLDVRRDEFYFAWHRMAAHDLYLLFWVAMLGVWGLVAVSFLYGRLWCGWVCPQTLASDFADSLRARLDRRFRVRKMAPPELGAGRAFFVSRSLWAAIILAMAYGTGLTLACYWLAPATVWRGATHPLADPAAAATVYGLAAVIAADMLWLRRKFCSHACPYGALMSLLADKNTLTVRYLDERDDECIHCRKCETDCPMGIDIKQGVGQFACIGCGECVDACNDVLGRQGKAGLIEYRYGTEPERVTRRLPLSRRLGLWDARRVAVVATWLACLGIALWSLLGSAPLSASVTNQGAITRDTHGVRDTYLLTLNNGTPDTHGYTVTVRGLPGVRVEPSAPISVIGRAGRTLPMTLIGPASLPPDTRYHVQLDIRAGRDARTLTTIFYAP